MKKKFLTMCLLGIMAMSVTACGGKGASDTSGQAVVVQNEAAESTAVEVEIRGNATLEFYRMPGDSVPEVLQYNKEISSRTDANPVFYANHIPVGATGMVVEFEMNDCNIEFDKVMWYGEFETEVKEHSFLEMNGMPQFEGNGTYRAVVDFSEYAPNETFKQLNVLRVDWYEGNNTLSESELAGQFKLTKVVYYTGNDIKDVKAELLSESSSEITIVEDTELEEDLAGYENESIDLTNTTILNIGEAKGYTLEMPVFTFAYSEKDTYETRYMANNSESDGREMYEFYKLAFQVGRKDIDGEEAYKKLLEDYNDWSGYSLDMGYTESAEIIGDASSRYILAYSVGKIEENGTDFNITDNYAIYDSETDTIYDVTLHVIKDTALYGKNVMEKSTAAYREELRNAMIALTDN